MRIIAGVHRGRALASVGTGDAGAHLRPTTDRVRENLFNMLTGGRFGDPVRNARVLDLFAGTGALGLEALSRGAARVTFVDSGRKAQSLIRENIARLGVWGETHLMACDARRLPDNPGQPFDLVFLDPPYGRGLGQATLRAAVSGGWVAADALVVWEENAPQDAPPDFRSMERRRYGETWITVLRQAGGDGLP